MFPEHSAIGIIIVIFFIYGNLILPKLTVLASPEDKNTHFLCIQPFFLRPGPPNFRLSLQYTHTLQSVATHPRHVPHLFFVVAAVGNQ